jgi:general secretion pathway protein K
MSLNKADSFYETEQVWNGAWAGLQVAIAAIREANDVSQDPSLVELLTGENTFSIGHVNCSITITEETGLLNVNHLKNTDGQLDRKRIDQLLRLIDLLNRQESDSPRIRYGIVPCLMDWVDRDDDVTHLAFIKQENIGAEREYYETCTPSCQCGNGPLNTVDELLRVKGVTPESFTRLRPLLTCVGDGKININAAPKLIIESLSERIDAAVAQMIVSRRRLKPFQTPAELRNVPGMTDNIYMVIKDMVTVSPNERYYRVTSQASVQDRRYTMEALLHRNTQAGNVDIVLYREL